jgi:hypothetical protein
VRAEFHRRQASATTQLDLCARHPREAPEKFKAATKQEIFAADERRCSRGKPTIPAAITSTLQRFSKSHAAPPIHDM